MSAPNVEQLEVPGADTTPADTPPSRPKRVRKPRTRKPVADKAPRAPRAPRPPRQTPIGPRMAALHEVLGSALVVGTMAPIPVLNMRVPLPVGAFGQQIAADAAAFGDAWAAYAKANPRVAEALDKLLTVSELGALLTLYGKAAYAGVAATGKVPPLDMVMASAAGPAPGDVAA